MKLIFFDIDGTLLPEGETNIDRAVISEIKNINEQKDTEVFICTGRSYHQAKEFIDKLGLCSYITSNGQEVCYKNELIYQKFLNYEQKNEIVHIAKNANISWGFESRSNIFIADDEKADKVQTILEGYGFVDIKVSNDLNKDIFQMWFFGEQENIKNSLLLLEKKYKCYPWNSECIEILDVDQSKANGIKIVENLFNNTETFAFGDGINDIEMLQHVDYSVAMGNASNLVKKSAKFITTDIKDNGILNGLKKVGLRK